MWQTVGMRAPVCLFCGSPNPKPLSDDEWNEVIGWAEDYQVGQHVRAAIERRRHGGTAEDHAGEPGEG